MKKKIVSTLLMTLVILPMTACQMPASGETQKEAKETETQPVTETPQTVYLDFLISTAEVPAGEFQLDVAFPNWQEKPSATDAINHRVGFFGYAGQGELYLTPEEGVESFSLYINDKRVPTEELAAGGTYRIDFSAIAENGENTIQMSGITPETAAVAVKIPYPVVIDGTPAEAGIAQESLDLIDRIISSDIDHGFPSAQLAIVRNGKLVYEKSWGQTVTYDKAGNPTESAPVTNETLYDLASNTKMYSVNYAVQYLVSRGELDLDAKITDILGEEFAEDTIEIAYDGYDAVDLETNKAWKAGLTVRDLLSHQGGFPDGPQYFNDRYDPGTFDFDYDGGNVLYAGSGADAATREETLHQIFRTPLMYEPGTKTLYSDVDYMILCFVVEKITGEGLDTFCKKTFWEPMGLSHITYNPLENGFAPEDTVATELMGNSRDGNLHYTGLRTETVQGEVHDPNAYYGMDGVSGHAGLFSNASDLARLASVMLTGGYGNTKFFSVNTLDLFTAPHDADISGYGLGWWRDGDHARDRYFGSTTASKTFGHQGFTGTLTTIDPENDLVVVLLTNKIHSRLLPGDETLSAYGGNYYTTATLGFVPEILAIGMDDPDADPAVYRSFVADLVSDAAQDLETDQVADPNDPRAKKLAALEDVLNGM